MKNDDWPELMHGRFIGKKGGRYVGRFLTRIEIANNDDLVEARNGHLDFDKVRRITLDGVVDSGAARLVLPASAVKQLGLLTKRNVTVRYADRRKGTRKEVGGAHVTLLGRDDVFSAVVEPKRTTALIGAIVLETLDLLVDCTREKVYPRHPDFVLSEIE
jgi:predicted aspartyl protease